VPPLVARRYVLCAMAVFKPRLPSKLPGHAPLIPLRTTAWGPASLSPPSTARRVRKFSALSHVAR
jgi:hypothetical protein